MSLKHYSFILILMLMRVGVAYSQEIRTEICIDFRVSSDVIDPAYSDNAARIKETIDFLKSIREDKTVNLIEVSFCGAASPEGSDQLNRRLARGRLSALERLVRKEVHIPDSLITRNDSYIPWENLKSQIEASELECKNEVIAILEEESKLVNYHQPNTHIDNRIVKIRQLKDGKVWEQMQELFFEPMRNASAVFITIKTEMPSAEPTAAPKTVVAEQEPVVEEAPEAPVTVETVTPEVKGWSSKMHIKTNVIGLGMGIGNLAVEIDLAPHWSIAVPFYYSGGFDYIKPTVKFRGMAVQPEARFYVKGNDGFYLGAHLGLGWYNFALDGEFRIQDHKGRTPAYGGGLGLGYALNFKKNPHWGMEFSIGGGAYKTKYDIFYNEHNGPYAEHGVEDWYYGVDNASISFTYSFNLKKEGRR